MKAARKVVAAAAAQPTIIDLMNTLFARSFVGPSWDAWRAFLHVLFNLPMSSAQKSMYEACTGRSDVPTQAFSEAWLVCGRRAGKSRILALIATYLALFNDWNPFLAPGERGTLLVIATDRRQAKVILRYTRALINSVPALDAMVIGETADSIDLSNSVSIEVSTASFRAVRGHTIIAALLDEVSYWRSDESSANPDREILDALKPAMSTIPGAMLLAASSPYSRKGVLWDAYRRHFGQAGAPALVWKASTRTMNPKVPQRIIDEAIERDPAAAAAEYGAEFRSDLEGFLSPELIGAAIEAGRIVRPPQPKIRYVAFADPSGGAGDSFTAAVAHLEGNVAVLDAIYERRPPFNPASACGEIAELLGSYQLRECTGDKYAAGWVVGGFKDVGVVYRHSERDRSQIYMDCLALFTSGRISLLDHKRLAAQFGALERRTGAGRDRVDHGIGGHDDLSNSAAGALTLLSSRRGPIVFTPEVLAQLDQPVRSRFWRP